MRLICINNGPIYNYLLKRAFSVPELIEGEVYTVKKESNTWYELIEISPKNTSFYGFRKERFVPTSDLDEMELVNEKVLVKR